MSLHHADRVYVASTSWERSLFAWSQLVFWGITAGAIVTHAPSGTFRAPTPTTMAAIGAFAVSLAAMLLPRLRPSGKAGVTVEERRLVWRRGPFEGSIPRSKLLSGHVVRSGAFYDVELRVSDGRLLRIGFQTLGPARELLEALGLAAETHRAVVTFGDPAQGRWTAAILGAMSFLGCRSFALSPTGLKALGGQPGTMYVALAITALLGVVALFKNVFTEMHVGLDFVEIRRFFRRRRIPLDTIESADEQIVPLADGSVRRALVLRLASGEVLRLAMKVRASFDGRLAAVAARILQAKAAREQLSEARQLELLARGDDTVDAWRKRVVALTTSRGSYRQASILPEELARIARNPSASAEQRIAAAMAVSASADPALHHEVRIAADACVAPRLRVALRQALKGKPELDAIEDALEDEVSAEAEAAEAEKTAESA